MRRFLVSLVVLLGLSALAPSSNAQNGVFSDPFSLYYGFYLPRQQVIANQRTSQDVINDAAIARQESAAMVSEREGLYDDIQPFALDELDRDRPFGRTRGLGRSYEERPAATFGNASKGTGTSSYFGTGAARSLAQFHPGLKPGSGQNRNVRSSGGFGGSSSRSRFGGNTSASAQGSRHDELGRISLGVGPEPLPWLHFGSRGRGHRVRSMAGRAVMDRDHRSSSPLGENDLVAFLAGELGDGERCSVSAILASDPSARREVELLRGTWDLLDLLPFPKASDDLGMRTFAALRRVESGEIDRTSIDPRASGIIPYLAAASLMAIMTFATARWAWHDRGARLSSRLSIAEHLDEYRDVGTIEFLRELDKSPEFDEAE